MIRIAVPLGITMFVLVSIAVGAENMQDQNAAHSLRVTEDSVKRAVVQAYALEGFYPVNLQYLIDNYGIRPNLDRYIVHYDFVGDNLLPTVVVMPK